MRVVSGKYRSIVLESLPSDKTRPTLDKVKEAVFSSLYDVNNYKVLDLFSGSGGIGIEALSRGASRVVFNDKSRQSVEIIKKNLMKVKANISNYEVYNLDYVDLLKRMTGCKFDLIYLDPPFDSGEFNECLKMIETNDLLSDDGVIVIESELNEIFVTNYLVYKVREYGRIKVSYYKKG
ncbi:MAG: 16S rRNA (guanine(966)-N(2))-methyltransferase RsmD [Erysipelotrichaceae bacterium]